MPIDPTRLPTPHDGPDDDDGLGRADVIDLGHKRLDDAPAQIGPYRVLETIGEGGMGVVYRAQQRVPIKRDVVIKLIKLGMDTKLVIARFEAERQALAMMDHPNIAKVFDAGTDETGRPYFVMEYVKGQPITEFADAHKLTIEERLRLMQQVCDAIQHAHHKGVVHRDLKPSNVLATLQDGKPSAKVIDFGIAKAMNAQLTDRTLFTQHHQMIGTPEYMSPEQANGSIDVDTRTDVYSLGVLLYELLTGQTPFDAKRLRSAAYDAMVRIIREEDPPRPSARLSTISGGGTSVPQSAPSTPAPNPPSTLSALAKSRSTTEREFQREVKGELDWLVMKSMDKDRGRRYATPTELSQDIERYLNGTPVVAVPPSWAYRASKFTRKYKRSILAAATLVALLCAGIAGTSWQAHRANVNAGLAATQRAAAEDALAVAERQRAEALLAAYIANLSLAKSAMENNDWPGARRFLNECPTPLRQWEWRFMMRRASRYEFALPVSSEVVACSPDESRIATATSNGGHASTIHLWSPADGKLLRSIGVPFETGSIRFSPDGRTVLASDAGARFDQTVGDYSVSTWDAESGSPTTEFKLGPMDEERGAALRMQGSAVLSPSGRYLARWNVDTMEVWDCSARKQLFMKRGDFARYGSAAFAADESTVAFTSKQQIECVDLRTGASRKVFAHGIARPTPFEPQVRLSPSGRFVWMGIGALNQDWTLFDAQTGAVLAKIDNGWADSVPLYTPDESSFITASNALVGFVSNTPSPEPPPGTPTHVLRMSGTAAPNFSPDGMLLASNALIMQWPSQKLIAELRGERADREWLSVAVMPRSRRLLIGRDRVTIASLESVDQVAYVMTPWMMAADAWRSRDFSDPNAQPYKVEIARDGRTVLTRAGRSTTLARAGTTPINVHALSHDGERLAYADGDHVTFVGAASGRELIRLPVLNYSSADENRFPAITKLSFAEQDQWLRIEYDDKMIEVWDVRDATVRQSERDTFDATRAWAEKHVAALLAGAKPEQRHIDQVKSDASLTELQRLFALEAITLRQKAVEYRERTRQEQQQLQQFLRTAATRPASESQPAN
jgi:serine/threonine protein kinase/WD40 repeat protein